MAKQDIPHKVNLAGDDPFLKYLGQMYNSGIDYMQQSRTMLHDIDDYQVKLDDYMKHTKLEFLLAGDNSKK